MTNYGNTRVTVVVVPRRWVVDRTFGWMTRWRRLVRDYAARIHVSEAMTHLSMGSLELRRIAPWEFPNGLRGRSKPRQR